MNRKIAKSLMASLVFVSLSHSAWARDRATAGGVTTTTAASTPAAPAATPVSGSTAAATLASPGYKQAAQDAAAGQKSASKAGQMIGPALIGAGTAVLAAPHPNKAYGYALIGGGALALLAGSHNSKKAGQSDNLADQFSTGAGNSAGTATNSTDVGGAAVGTTDLDPAAQKAIADAKKAGVTIDLSHGTMTLPDGSKVNLAEMQSPEQLGSAVGGMSAADMAKLKDSLQKAKGADGAPASAATATSGGGEGALGGGNGHGGSEETGNSGNQAGSNGTGKPLGVDRNPAQVAGMCTRLPDGSCMGVAAESIFTMIDRRFDVVCQQGQLIVNCPKK